MADYEDFSDDDGLEEEYQETGELDDSIADDEDAGQSEGKRKAKAEKPFNLFENEAFRAWQAGQDKRIADMEFKYRREVERAEQAVMAKMTTEEKREYGQSKLARENEELRQRLEEQSLLAHQTRVISQIMAETGAPLDAIDTSSEAAAVRSAYQWKEKNKRPVKKSRADDDYEDDNEAEEEERPQRRRRTDLGSGQTRRHTPESKLKADYQAALKSGDVWAAIQISDRAMQRGLNLRPEG